MTAGWCEVCGFATEPHPPWCKHVRELRATQNYLADRIDRLEQTSGSTGASTGTEPEASLSDGVPSVSEAAPGRPLEEPCTLYNAILRALAESARCSWELETGGDELRAVLTPAKAGLDELRLRAEHAEKERDELREKLTQSRACVDGLFAKLAAAENERDGLRAIMKTAAVEISELKAKLGGP